MAPTPHIEYVDTERNEFLASFPTDADREQWVRTGGYAETPAFLLWVSGQWHEWDTDYGGHQRFFVLATEAHIADKNGDEKAWAERMASRDAK